MSFIPLLFLYLLFSGSIMYLLMCVDSNNPGILGKLNRFIFRMCPATIKFIFIILVFELTFFFFIEIS